MGDLRRWTSFFLVVIWAQQIVGPPAVVKKAPANNTVPDHPDNLEKPEDDAETKIDLEYNRYLKEVVDALETDPEFRRKLETAEEVDFRTGKVAAELEYVNHHVRTKLDELKRTELSRLRELLKLEEERKKKEEDPTHHGHLDDSNPHTFEVQDLQMLMNKVRYDLDKADEQRRSEFKEYEMQKEFEKEQKLKTMDEEHKKEYLKELEEEKKQQQHHEPVHHPGSKAQLEEVWEKTDQMSQQFDPKAFFYLHDLDGNGYWDEAEVNALFIKELDKIYAQSGNNHIDTREREEEMERMREHVFKETDTNRDRFISFDEFLAQTKRDEWRRDEGWQSIDQRPQFTQAEYEEFERRRQAEIQRLIDQGALPMHPAGMQPPYQYVHPNQVPHGQHPNVGYQQGHGQGQYAVPQYQGHPGVAQQQYQQHPGAGQPQYQAHPAAAAPGHPQYQAHPGAGQPQYQAHPGAGQPQYQAHPAAGQPQYQAHPGAGQPQYQAHPGAGQPQYQAHPAAGQPQYQAHPAAGQPQYQAHPAAGQPQYQAHPAAGQPQYQAHPAAGQPNYQAHADAGQASHQAHSGAVQPQAHQPPQPQAHQSQQAGQPQYQAAQPNLTPPAGKPEPHAAQLEGQNSPAAAPQANAVPPQNHPAPPQKYNVADAKINEIPKR